MLNYRSLFSSDKVNISPIQIAGLLILLVLSVKSQVNRNSLEAKWRTVRYSNITGRGQKGQVGHQPQVLTMGGTPESIHLSLLHQREPCATQL